MTSGYTEQLMAENKILSYKLATIRKYIENRMPNTDTITKNEFKVILKMISNYEHVTADWELDKALVDIPSTKESEDNV